MRNPKRINIILKYLGYYWKKNPDLRLCQLLGNIAAQANIDVYYYAIVYGTGIEVHETYFIQICSGIDCS